MFELLEVTNVELEKERVDTSGWQRIFMDLEGSLTATEGDIVQLATITTDWNFNITGAFNMYFKNKSPISLEEYKVHGISEEFLEKYGEEHFSQMVDKTPLKVDRPTMFISYTTFDINRINAELGLYDLPLIDFGEEKSDLAYNLLEGENCHFNAFRLGRKRGELLSKELGDSVFDGIYDELKNHGNFHRRSNHDALFDTVMILALCRSYANG